MKKGLIIIHIDGLGYSHLQTAIKRGYMPYLKKLLKTEDYEIINYRSGLPSTTPFVQAGILYGDNKNIPSFRWWDKESGVMVRFGPRGTFGKVAHKYFKNTHAITKDGACIAACFSGDAIESFTLGSKAPQEEKEKRKQRSLFRTWISNPLRVFDWLYSSIIVIIKYALEYANAYLQKKLVAKRYFLAHMLYEIFLHHLTRFAVTISMRENFPVIYAAIYAYDEATHAFGPNDNFTYRILRQVDETIQYIGKRRVKNKKQKVKYELLILSDHGQVETIPFEKTHKKRLGEVLSEVLPKYKITEEPGDTITPRNGQDGEIVIAASGGLAHVYFKSHSWRMNYSEMEKTYGKVLQTLASLKEVAFVMVKEKKQTIILHNKLVLPLTAKNRNKVKKLLKQYGDPDLLLQELTYLNSFDKAGDILVFGNFIGDRQINFENQYGGHGSIGGEQEVPFLFVKREWKLNGKKINNPIDVHKRFTNLITLLRA